MTEQEMINAFEAHSNEITALLEGSDATTINGKDSVRKIVKRFINTLARNWSISRRYVVGDVVTYNTNLYLCKSCHHGINPAIEPDTWLQVNANENLGESGFSKKCCVREGKIISGNDFFSSYTVRVNSDSNQLKFVFKRAAANDNYIIIPTYVNKDTYAVFDLGVPDEKKNRYGFTLLSRNNASLDSHSDAGTSTIEQSHEPYEINIAIKEV